jgi:signal transduction histidine kinase
VSDTAQNAMALRRLERENKRLRTELDASLRQLPDLRNMIAFSGDALALLDAEGRITEANARLITLLGDPEAEIYGQAIARWMPVAGQWAVLADRLRQLQTGDTQRMEISIGARGASASPPVEVELTAARLPESTGSGLWAVSLRDLGERRRLESSEADRAVLARLNATLALQFRITEAIEQSVDVFSATVSLMQPVCETLDWDYGGLWLLEGQQLRYAGGWHRPECPAEGLLRMNNRLRFGRGEGLPGRAWESGKVVWIADVGHDPGFWRAPAARSAGLHSALALPVSDREGPWGVIEFLSRRRSVPAAEDLDAFAAIVRQIAQGVARERSLEALRQAQKTEALGQLTSGLAHDFNNLLGIVLGNLELLAPLTEAPELTTARNAAGRAAEVSRAMLAVARRQSTTAAVLDINAELRQLLPLLQSALGTRITLHFELLPGELCARMDGSLLASSVLNLVINARDALRNPRPGAATEIRLRSRCARLDAPEGSLPPGDYAIVEVEDTGAGMHPEVRARAFEPFYTTKPRGQGTGLGLSTVLEQARQFGGTARIESPQCGGTTVAIWLPLVTATPAETPSMPAATDTPEAAASPAGSLRILVVDDQKSVCELACEYLKRLGHSPTPAYSAGSALGLLGSQRFDLLFTDVVMPGAMDGLALAREARRRWPSMPVLLCSGYTEGLDEGNGGFPVLDKPYRERQLRAAIEDLIDEFQGRKTGPKP